MASITDDEDYSITWGRWDITIPTWLGEWLEELLVVPYRTTLTLMGMGLLIGLVIAAMSILLGMYLAWT